MIDHMGMEMERVDFDYESEWVHVNLADGTVLKLKVEVAGVLRAVGRWDERGEPIYQLSTTVQIAFVSVPDELTKPKPQTGAITP